MSKEDFDRFLALLGGFLNLDRKQREAISDELRDHLEMRVDSLKLAGIDDSAAQKQALEEFGDAAGMAARFVTLAQRKKRRRLMRIASISTFLAVPMVICAILFWPESGDPSLSAPSAVAQQDDDAVVVENEIESELPVVNAVESRSIAASLTSSNSKDLDTEKLLNKTVSIQGGFRFADLLSRFEKEVSLQFLLHISAQDTITFDTEIDEHFNLQGVSLKTGLDLLLEVYDCTFTIKDGMIVILSVDEAESPEQHVTRVFYVKDILDELRRNGVSKRWNSGGKITSNNMGGGIFSFNDTLGAVSESKSGLNQDLGQTTAGGLGGKGASKQAATTKQVTEVDVLCNAINVMILPDRWESNGGTAHMFLMGDSLAVRADYVTIRKVQSFLNDLRVNLGIEPDSK